MITGKITSIALIVIEGTTHYYICVEGLEDIFDIDMTDENLIQIVRYVIGDRITLEFTDELGLNPVQAIK